MGLCLRLSLLLLGLLCPHLCFGAQRVRVGVAPTPTDNEGSQTMTTSSTDDSSQSMFGESRLKRSAKNDKKDGISPHMVADGLRNVKRMFNLNNAADDVEIKDEIETVSGTRRVRLTQRYNGMRVFGVSTSVELDEVGQPTGSSLGHVINGIHYDINITGSLAIDSAEAVYILQQLYHPDPTGFQIRKPETEKVIYVNNNSIAIICWYVNYLALDEAENANHSRPHGLIDAQSGEVVKSWDGLDTLRVRAVGGNEKTGSPKPLTMHIYEAEPGICYYKSSKAQLMDLQNNAPHTEYIWKVRGMPCHAVNDSQYFDYSNGGYSPMNEVYLYSMYTHDTFMSTVGRAPLGSSTESRIIRAKAHVQSCYDNAFWDGEFINIGDGCSFFYPLSSVDVVAHEVGHGFTSWTSGLIYRGQSGGLNEAFSDMAGETVEYFYRQSTSQGSNDWKIGDEITKNRNRPMRYVDEPTLDGQSIDHVDSYTNAYYERVHYTSGIYNKAFYTLSTKPGWGIIKAFKVFATANLMEWEADTTFHCAACGVMNSADYLGFSVSDVTAALSVVGAVCDLCT